MNAVPIIGFVLVALLAIAFAVVPLWRIEDKKGPRLAAGGGRACSSWPSAAAPIILLGRPHLAQREASGLKTREVNGLIPYLIQRVRQYPQDARAWRYLGQAYMEARDPRDAAKALAKVIELTGKGDPALDAAYGEALVLANGGAVPPEAEDAFTAALAVDPAQRAGAFLSGAGQGRAQRPRRRHRAVAEPAGRHAGDRAAAPDAGGPDGDADVASGGRRQGGAPNPRAMVDDAGGAAEGRSQ